MSEFIDIVKVIIIPHNPPACTLRMNVNYKFFIASYKKEIKSEKNLSDLIWRIVKVILKIQGIEMFKNLLP